MHAPHGLQLPTLSANVARIRMHACGWPSAQDAGWAEICPCQQRLQPFGNAAARQRLLHGCQPAVDAFAARVDACRAWARLLQDVYYKLGIPPEDVVAVHELRDLLVQVS